MRARLLAFLIHLAVSATVVGVLVLLSVFVWYPGPLMSLQGAWQIIALLVAVDVIIGPFLTLIVFKPGKRDLRFDLTVIVSIQLAAFLYGSSVIYLERPAYLAYAYSQFYVVRGRDVVGAPGASISGAQQIGVAGPRVVSVSLPDSDVRNGTALLAALLGDPGMALRADRYAVLASGSERLLKESLSARDILSIITKQSDKWPSNLSQDLREYKYYRIRGRQSEGVAIVDPADWTMVAIINQSLTVGFAGQQ